MCKKIAHALYFIIDKIYNIMYVIYQELYKGDNYATKSENNKRNDSGYCF